MEKDTRQQMIEMVEKEIKAIEVVSRAHVRERNHSYIIGLITALYVANIFTKHDAESLVEKLNAAKHPKRDNKKTTCSTADQSREQAV